MPDDTTRWYCARAKPGQERTALEHLGRQSFPTFYPQVVVKRIRRERIVTKPEPLFPGYILVALALSVQAWRAVNGTRGIIRLVSFAEDGTPSALPTAEVEKLQRAEKSGQLKLDEFDPPRRKDVVRVKFGHLADQQGLVEMTRLERITVLLTLLGQKTKVTLPAHALEIVARADSQSVR